MLDGGGGTRQTRLQFTQLVLRASDVETRREPVLHAFLGQAQRTLPDRDIVLQDLLFALRPAQVHIRRRCVCRKRETKCVDIMLTARQLRLCRQQFKALPAEYIGCPAKRETSARLANIAERRWRVLARIGGRGRRVEFWQERRATLGRHGLGLLHPLKCGLNIQVLAQHRAHQFMQHRVAELLPPCVGIRAVLRRVGAPVGGRYRLYGRWQIRMARRLHGARRERHAGCQRQ
ncbi:hypothetical protein AWB69_06369 [Caballeronia udeis]|uniref:Uncharacterized protein n=1 Tax=Caballeronia udeis TaxID=1232866 RepID=A0A158IN51_9BURK|nr:hypothetical protein AWB69_06369 [Caballeronia udeis]